MRLVSAVLGFCLIACAPPPDDPDASDAARYFGLRDGTATLLGPGGISETVELSRDTTVAAEREVFSRIARRGGFVEDDGSFFLEASLEGLFLVRFFDCVSRCGEPTAPFQIAEFPIDERGLHEDELEVELSRNGVVEETRTERHRFQVGTSAPVTVPAGDFSGVDIAWTRVVDEQTDAFTLTFVEEVGFVRVTGPDGSVFELNELP